MECLRCGNCCTQHPAFASPGEIQRINSYLGITMDEWQRRYAGEGPDYYNHFPVRQVNGACVFLRKRGSKYACAIHPVKPDCCADWEPGLDKKECREGFNRIG
jgi:Fe-S-cluster containining protein